jgi:hypothetical protein
MILPIHKDVDRSYRQTAGESHTVELLPGETINVDVFINLDHGLILNNITMLLSPLP